MQSVTQRDFQVRIGTRTMTVKAVGFWNAAVKVVEELAAAEDGARVHVTSKGFCQVFRVVVNRNRYHLETLGMERV